MQRFRKAAVGVHVSLRPYTAVILKFVYIHSLSVPKCFVCLCAINVFTISGTSCCPQRHLDPGSSIQPIAEPWRR